MGKTFKAGDDASIEEDEIIEDEENIQDDDELEEEDEDLSDDDEESDDEGDEGDDDEEDDEDLSEEELRKKLKKAKEIAKNQKIRAEKAEAKLKGKKPASKAAPSRRQADLSTSDVLTLVKANVHEEDIQEVRDYATLKKISIKDALKSNFIKSFLADREEERRTAEAANTGNRRRTTGKKQSSQVLEEAQKGILPDDPAELAKARLAKRQADRQHRR